MTNIPRANSYQFYSRFNQRLVDALIFGASFYLAYEIRFASKVPPLSEQQMWLLLVPIAFAGAAVTSLFGIYRQVWRYISLGDAILVGCGQMAFSALVFLVCSTLPDRWALLRIPRSIILIHFLLSLVTALSVRALRRVSYEWKFANRLGTGKSNQVVLVGAGPAGLMVAKELTSSPGIRAVGFLDDDPEIIGTQMCGLRVLGPVDSLASVVQKYAITEVIVSVARDQQKVLRRVWALCEELSVRIRVVPTLEEILNGKINLSALKEVDTDELMGRERANIVFNEETAAQYRGKSILITGAGGSIGSELANQLVRLYPRELILLDKDENGLHDACLRMQSQGGTVSVHPVVANLRFADKIQGIFSRFRPDIVFHAAAHKHVPLMEMNPCEAILNNVVGTRNVVDASLAHAVSRFVLVSTDKAVRPASIMGASKRVSEMIVKSRSNSKICRFSCVRFGNVLGSRGSVLPTFQKQVAQGEPLKITHKDVRRYLMTIPEAVSLLIQAGTLASSQTFVLDMGEQVFIRDLASRLIEYCGLRPGWDIPIEVACLRPGEKLSEELFDDSTERLLPTSIPRINAIHNPVVDETHFAEKLAALELAAQEDSPAGIKRILGELNIGFCAQEAATGTTDEELVYEPVAAAQLARAARH